MAQYSTALASCAVAAALLVGGCSNSLSTALEAAATAQGSAQQRPQPAAKAPVGQKFAGAALDDRSLATIRGGLSTGSGLVLNFSFQEATYVNNQLAQSIVVPTVTVSPGSNSAVLVSASSGAMPSAIVPIGTSTTQAQVGSPALAVQSILNQGMTSVVSSFGGGITNTIANAANNQLVQQVITANINVAGLSQTIQQSVASTVASRVAAANSQFR